uniref:Uncharacterized protein n=1 Tax=Triticum urartu TaxID=4572 RepID=A0A8R7QLE4_TRIUA
DIAGAGGVGRAGGRRDADHAARRRQRGGPLLRPPELQGAHSPIRLRHPPGVPRHGVAALLRRDRPRRRRRPPHHAVTNQQISPFLDPRLSFLLPVMLLSPST